jgi:hypothetical protein
MNNDIIELFREMHQYVDAFNQNIMDYHSGETDYVDYSSLQKTFEINEKLADFDWGEDSTKWLLYEKASRFLSQERYEELIEVKVLIDALEKIENEVFHTDI